ncbi:MAG: HlyD family efflux transporter periplasmic adaptor subunit [Sporomusaceae bacterium]|nr:HlyD family efflux transporter periplasmic adaptor subunit [Sporomusaceae bacterium]
MKVSFSSTKKNDGTSENNVKLPYASAKRAFPKIRWILILMLVASPFIMMLGKIVLDWVFVTSPGTIWMEKKTINSIEAGTVEKVFYHRGDMASPDTVMFRVKRKNPENRMEQIAFLEAERDAANMGIETGNSSPEISSRNISNEIQLANESVAYYEQARGNTKWLMDQGAATKAEMDLAENKLREAKASLGALTSSSVPNTIKSSAPAVNSARIAQVEQNITSLKKMTEGLFDIKSGQGGKVHSIFVSDGQSFAAGEPLAVVLNTQQVHIVTYVDPNDFKKIRIGTTATVKILGTGRKIKGVVEQPPVVADHVPSGISEKFYPVTMRGVQIFLKVMDPLQEEETIEGLPVVVEW